MTIKVTCEACGKQYQVDAKFAGKKGKCKQCGAIFNVPAIPTESSNRPAENRAARGSGTRAGQPAHLSAADETGVDLENLAAMSESAIVDGTRTGSFVASPGFSAPPGAKPRKHPAEDLPDAATRPSPDLLQSKLPLALVLVGVGLPVVLQAVDAIHSPHPILGFAVLLVAALLLAGVIVPLAVLGLRIGARLRNIKLPPKIASRTFAAFAMTPLFFWLVVHNAPAPAAPAQGAVQSIASDALALIGPMVTGLIIGLAISYFAVWFLFRLSLLDALVAWLVGGVGYVLGTAVTVGVAVLVITATMATSQELHAKPKPTVAHGTSPAVTSNHGAAPNPASASASTPTKTPGSSLVASGQGPGTTPGVVEAKHPRLDEGDTAPPAPAPAKVSPAEGAAGEAALPPVERLAGDPTPVANVTGAQSFVAGPVNSPWVVVRKPGDAAGQERLQRLNLDTLEANGEMATHGGSAAHYILSPAGDKVVETYKQPAARLEVWSFDTAAMTIGIDVTAPRLPDLVGFAGPTKFICHVTNNTGEALAVCDVASASIQRTLKIPEFIPEATVVMPNGRAIAVAVAGTPPEIGMLDVNGGTPRQFRLSAETPNARPISLAVSRDGMRLAAVLADGDSQRICVIRSTDGAMILNQAYPPFGAGAVGPTALLMDGQYLLLRGNWVIDVASGRVLGELGTGTITVADKPDRVLSLAKDGSLAVESLKVDELKKRAAAAEAAGPLTVAPATPLQKWNSAGATVRLDAPPGAMNLPAEKLAKPKAVSEQPIPLSGAPETLRRIFFASSNAGVAVVCHGSAGASGDEPADAWAGSDPLHVWADKVDLTNGKTLASAELPVASDVLWASPDVGTLLLVSPGGKDLANAPRARLDVWSISGNHSVAAWPPYADIATNRTPKPVRWAAIADRDHVLTLDGERRIRGAGTPAAGGTLVGWSMTGRRAVWAWENVQGTPTLSPGGTYVIAKCGSALRCINTATGESCGELDLPAGAAVDPAQGSFSPDGKRFAAISGDGIYAWDLTTGKPTSSTLVPGATGVDIVNDGHLIVGTASGDKLFDPDRHMFDFTYRLPPGGHDVWGEAAGRHWYTASADGQGEILCFAAIPTPENLAAAQQFADHPPLIQPGAVVAVQVDAGAESGSILEAVTKNLESRGLLVGPNPVATLRLTAKRVEASASAGSGSTLPAYDCTAELLDSAGKVLRANPPERITGDASAKSPAEANESALQRVKAWGSAVTIAPYITVDGSTPAMKPEMDLPGKL